MNSVVATLSIFGLISLAGSGSVWRLDIATKAYVDSGANVAAGGSLEVNADDSTAVDLKADAAGLGAFATAGASIAFAWVDKIVEAYVAGPDAGRGLGAAVVSATGSLPAITANTGDFTIAFDPNEDTADPGGIESPFGDMVSALADVIDNPFSQAVADLVEALFGLATSVTVPDVDPSLAAQRTSTPITSLVRGVAITAISRDDVETLARGLSGSVSGLSVSPEMSGSGALFTNQTSAFVAAGAQVNTGQDVRVAAGSDVSHMGIAGAAAIAGNVPVGVATNLTLIDTTTQAFIAGQVGNLAPVQNVEVRAFAKEDVLAISGALSVSTGDFGINLAASLPVISIDSETSAFVDANGFVDALGNVLIKARDDTDTDTIGGNGSLSGAAGASVGATASVTIIDKETRAWIGQNATVHADGDTTSTIEVANGPVNFDFDPVSAVNLAANTDRPGHGRSPHRRRDHLQVARRRRD